MHGVLKVGSAMHQSGRRPIAIGDFIMSRFQTILVGIGSVTKSFTVVGLGMLADERKLDWDKPIYHYLPDFHFTKDRIFLPLEMKHSVVMPGSDLRKHPNAAKPHVLREGQIHTTPGLQGDVLAPAGSEASAGDVAFKRFIRDE